MIFSMFSVFPVSAFMGFFSSGVLTVTAFKMQPRYAASTLDAADTLKK